MARVEVKVPQTEFELGIPKERKTLEETKEKREELIKEQKEVKKELSKAQIVLAKRKLARKKKLLSRLKELGKIRPKKLQIDASGRAKLLKAIIEKKKRVNILARIEDKIPSVFTRKDPHETTFLSKGRLI